MNPHDDSPPVLKNDGRMHPRSFFYCFFFFSFESLVSSRRISARRDSVTLKWERQKKRKQASKQKRESPQALIRRARSLLTIPYIRASGPISSRLAHHSITLSMLLLLSQWRLLLFLCPRWALSSVRLLIPFLCYLYRVSTLYTHK